MPYTNPEKAKQYRRAHYLKHREQYLERAREWYANNREHCIKRETKRNQTPEGLARRRSYYRKNAAFYVAKTNEWRKNNPDKFRLNYRLYVEKRRARLLGAPGDFTNQGWLAKVLYHGWRCFYCKAALTQKTLTIDHRIPLSNGGTNWLANLVPACRPCNSRKGAKAV